MARESLKAAEMDGPLCYLEGRLGAFARHFSPSFQPPPMSPTPFISALLLFLGVVTASASVQAARPPQQYPTCEEAPSPSDIQSAQGAYRAGHVSFEEADYDRALLYWEDAFRRDCTAVKLLLSLARAYELSKSNSAAVVALETYFDRVPDYENRASVARRIERLKLEIAKENSSEKTERTDQPQAVATDGAKAEGQSAAARVIWPIFVTGGGVALAISGHVVLAGAHKKANALGCDVQTDTCPNDEATREASDAEKKARQLGIPLTVAGHAIGAIGGVLWYFLWTRSPDEHAAFVLQPVISPSFQGISLTSAF